MPAGNGNALRSETLLASLRDYVREIGRWTRAAPPTAGFEGEAEFLRERPWYFICLIGGKEVGKTALAGALTGRTFGTVASHGPGTRKAVVHAHSDLSPEIGDLLESELPDRFELVPHSADDLKRQVFVDLPDVDSLHSSHLEIAARILRHTLYPVWVQSVEKYADARPREILCRISELNDPSNFLFCLNKIDQVVAAEGPEAAREISLDYADRISRSLGLDSPPRIWNVSALQPNDYDLPALRARLAVERGTEEVSDSKRLSLKRIGKTLFAWIEDRSLPSRVEALDRSLAALRRDAADRLAPRIVARAVPALLDDPAFRALLAARIQARRVRSWPIVRGIPDLASARNKLSLAPAFGPPEERAEPLERLVGRHLESEDGTLRRLVEGVLARKSLSDSEAAETVRPDLEEEAAAAVKRLSDWLIERVRSEFARIEGVRRYGFLGGTIRGLLTYGSLVWFPFVQPALVRAREDSTAWVSLLLEMASLEHIAKYGLLLGVYFLFLRLLLRRRSVREAARICESWKGMDPEGKAGPGILPVVTEWMESLLEETTRRRDRLRELLEEGKRLKRDLDSL